MLALAPSPVPPDALLTPLAPGEAYAADVARLNGRAPIGPVDDAWLALAHALARAAQLPAARRAPLLAAGGEGVTALIPADAPAPVRAALVAAVEGVGALAELLGGRGGAARGAPQTGPDAEAVHAAVGALQEAVAQQEQAGAFVLAFSTLAALRGAFAPVLDRRAEGLLLAQQGRVARQLGAMAAAAEFYAESVRAARAARAPDVAARALIGGGVLASMRGNYPEARALFRRGLEAASQAGAEDHLRAGHHGLLVAAIAAKDVDTALAHGWAAFSKTSPAASNERAEMLVNLGDVGRQAGEYRASLGACLTALELTDVPRIRLPALGTAARAAAQLGEVKLLTFLARDLERTIARSGQPFEAARALVEFAEAATALHTPKGEEFAARAGLLAASGKFHEITARVERLRAPFHAKVASPRVPVRTTRSSRARDVLQMLERLPAVRRYADMAAC